MIRKSFIFFILLCGCVVQAAENSCQSQEDEELLCRVAHRLEFAFEDQSSVWVMVVRGGQWYTGVYDVAEEKVCLRCDLINNGVGDRIILPVMDYLQHEALRGYKSRRGCPPQTDFSKEFECIGGALNEQLYQRSVFCSESLRLFLTRFCSKIEAKGKAGGGDFGQRMTDAVLRSLEPPVGQWLSFVIVDEQSALSEMFFSKESDPIKVFMPIPGFGVLRGCAVSRETYPLQKESAFSQKSFYAHKINAVLKGMIERYPFDEETLKKCLNYGGAA